MKKFLFLLAFILPMACCFVGCSSDDEIKSDNISGCWEVYLGITPSYVTINNNGTFKMVADKLYDFEYNELITSRDFYKGTWAANGGNLELSANGSIIYKLRNVSVKDETMRFSYFDEETNEWKDNGQAKKIEELSVSNIEGAWLDYSKKIFNFSWSVISFYNDKTYKWTYSYPNDNHGYSRTSMTGTIDICGRFIVFTNFNPKLYFYIEQYSDTSLEFNSYTSQRYSGNHTALLKDESYHDRELEWLYTEK